MKKKLKFLLLNVILLITIPSFSQISNEDLNQEVYTFNYSVIRSNAIQTPKVMLTELKVNTTLALISIIMKSNNAEDIIMLLEVTASEVDEENNILYATTKNFDNPYDESIIYIIIDITKDRTMIVFDSEDSLYLVSNE